MSQSATLDPKRLEIAKALPLLHGGHDEPSDPDKPEACLLEMEGWIYGQDWGDCPPCVSPVLHRFGQRLNDRLPDGERQELRRFLGRLGGTAGDGQDDARRALAARWVINTGLPQWLELIGMTARADELRAMEVTKWTPALSDLLYKVRDEIWEKYPEPRRVLRQKIGAAVKAKLEEQGKTPAVAVAVAAAAADADAVAVAAAAADAVAVAAADAVAVAAADAVAVAAAAAVAVADSPSLSYNDVYWAVRKSDKVKEAIAKAVPAVETQREAAFELFEQLIDPSAVVAA